MSIPGPMPFPGWGGISCPRSLSGGGYVEGDMSGVGMLRGICQGWVCLGDGGMSGWGGYV